MYTTNMNRIAPVSDCAGIQRMKQEASKAVLGGSGAEGEVRGLWSKQT